MNSQAHEAELQHRSETHMDGTQSTDQGSKPRVYYQSAPGRYGRNLTSKVLSLGRDRVCWNCDASGHRLDSCRKPLDLVRIARNKAKFYDSKNKGPNGRGYKKVLYEAMARINHVLLHNDAHDPDDCPSASDSDGEDLSVFFLNDELPDPADGAPTPCVPSSILYRQLEDTRMQHANANASSAADEDFKGDRISPSQSQL